MSAPKHYYKDRTKGRSLTTKNGVGGITITAHLQCSRCPKVGDLNLAKILPPDVIDTLFRRHGWNVNSGNRHLCPDCIRVAAHQKSEKAKEGATMATNVTPAAMKAQGQMFQLLTLHFDTEKGQYAKGWSDKKIAADTGLAIDHVAAFRSECFGALRDAPEVVALRADFDAAEALANENHKNLIGQISAFRAELDRIARGT